MLGRIIVEQNGKVRLTVGYGHERKDVETPAIEMNENWIDLWSLGLFSSWEKAFDGSHHTDQNIWLPPNMIGTAVGVFRNTLLLKLKTFVQLCPVF